MKEEKRRITLRIFKVRIKLGIGFAGVFNQNGLIYTTQTEGRFKTIKAINNLFKNLWRVEKWV